MELSGERNTIARAGAFVLVLAAALVAHSGAVGNEFTNWDDPLYLTQNPLTEAPLSEGVGGLLTTSRIGYPIPVTVLGYAAQRSLFDLSPGGYHTVSLLLHLCVVALLFALVRRLVPSAPGAVAVAACALFAAHPLTVEPVAWVTGQKDLLAALFTLAALVVRCHPRGESPRHTVAAVLLALLALGSKPAVLGMPLLFLLVDLALRRRVGRAQNVAAYLTVTAVATGVAFLSLSGHGVLAGEAPRDFSARTLGEAGWALSVHAGHVVWPVDLTARYFPPPGAGFAIAVTVGVLLAGVAGAALVLAWRKREQAMLISVGGAALVYLPVSGLMPLTRGPADSYTYLPMALLVPIVVVAIAGWLKRDRSRPRAVGTYALLALVTVACALLSRGEVRDWSGAVPLWTDVAEAYPTEPRALSRLGDAHLFAKEYDRALAVYEHVRAEYPEHVAPRVAHGTLLELLGRHSEAEVSLAEGARLGDRAIYREEYAFFLLRHPELSPSDAAAAKRAIVELAPLLAERGKRIPTVMRAAELCRQFGEDALAERLEARAAVLEARSATPPR